MRSALGDGGCEGGNEGGWSETVGHRQDRGRHVNWGKKTITDDEIVARYTRHNRKVFKNRCHFGGLMINSLSFASDSGLKVCGPGLDGELVQSIGLNHSVEREVVSFQGCGAGINGLRLASQVCKEAHRCLVDTNVLVIHAWTHFALTLPLDLIWSLEMFPR